MDDWLKRDFKKQMGFVPINELKCCLRRSDASLGRLGLCWAGSLSVSESHRFSAKALADFRTLQIHRRSGISPCPEDVFNIARRRSPCQDPFFVVRWGKSLPCVKGGARRFAQYPLRQPYGLPPPPKGGGCTLSQGESCRRRRLRGVTTPLEWWAPLGPGWWPGAFGSPG